MKKLTQAEATKLVERLREARTWQQVSEPNATVYEQTLIVDPLCQEAAAALAQAQKDAERYRWLWQQTVDTFHVNKRAIYIAGLWPSPDGIDAAIDAAIKEQR